MPQSLNPIPITLTLELNSTLRHPTYTTAPPAHNLDLGSSTLDLGPRTLNPEPSIPDPET